MSFASIRGLGASPLLNSSGILATSAASSRGIPPTYPQAAPAPAVSAMKSTVLSQSLADRLMNQGVSKIPGATAPSKTIATPSPLTTVLKKVGVADSDGKVRNLPTQIDDEASRNIKKTLGGQSIAQELTTQPFAQTTSAIAKPQLPPSMPTKGVSTDPSPQGSASSASTRDIIYVPTTPPAVASGSSTMVFALGGLAAVGLLTWFFLRK